MEVGSVIPWNARLRSLWLLSILRWTMNSSRFGCLRLWSLSWLLTLTLAARADVILDWDSLMVAAIRVDNSGPTLSSRNLAILHTAIYDAVNSVLRTHQPYKFQMDVPGPVSAEAAAVGASYEVMQALYQPFRAQADDLFDAWWAGAAKDPATTNGLAMGRQVAEWMLQDRAADRSSTEVPYIPSDEPGQWRRTPPFFRPPLTPHWRYMEPFALPELEPFLPGPPPALESAEYAAAFNQVKELGRKNGSTRTAEESQIAAFWSDFSYTAMPPGHWHELAATIAQDRQNTLGENARLFALLSMAQADGAIACWESKYQYNLWRPVTAIQRAGEDNNPLTEADPAWEQMLPAPPFPSYTSGHSTFSKASAEVLTQFYGTDAIAFVAKSDSLPGVYRSFQSLAACADEVGMSRIYGGFHFMFDNVAGKECGQAVGHYVSANFLLPNSGLPAVRLERSPAAGLAARVHGHIGAEFVLESSPDLRVWTGITTNIASAGGVVVPLARAGQPCAFFRVREGGPGGL